MKSAWTRQALVRLLKKKHNMMKINHNTQNTHMQCWLKLRDEKCLGCSICYSLSDLNCDEQKTIAERTTHDTLNMTHWGGWATPAKTTGFTSVSYEQKTEATVAKDSHKLHSCGLEKQHTVFFLIFNWPDPVFGWLEKSPVLAEQVILDWLLQATVSGFCML